MEQTTTAAAVRDAQEAHVTFEHVIGGASVASADGAVFETADPHTGAVYGTVARGGEEDVARAVAAARSAFDDGPWPRLSTRERRLLLNRLADRIEQEGDALAAAESRDMGKPISESRGHDVPRAAYNFRFFADFQDHAASESFPMSGFHSYARHEPVGVAGAISPWNFPLMLASWKVAPALAFGNTVVLKPAEQSPATATMLGRIAAEVLPEGVLNVVHGFGPGEAGEALVRHPDVQLLTFTGETTTGQAIMQTAAPTLKRLSLELGGKSPNLVFADADLDAAVAGTIRGIFSNQGEVCLAGSRLLVERAVYDEFLARLVAAAERLPIGPPLEETTKVGPLVSHEHRERVEGYVAIAAEDGGRVLTGGSRPDDPALAAGAYLRPTVIADLPRGSRCVREEIFGPVLVVAPFDDEAEAIRVANDTPYGLAAMLWTQDLRRAHRVGAALDVGTVWVNCFFVRDLRAPFGGAKGSGMGREGGYYSREFFTEAKTITMAL
ncbi:aldehyde dehydrogenase [Conexibacter stalactiti]|uniref:Aldehyde dehydrogenase n=1 Tax=Conexibacter stalactiti TaxID=1940611 RepID=A0ABU4HMV6_9ACTN|nr:aldehyde dehydrogenase [Conexibacter stalactiti]MDW5594052.1 aldehyde dehydrogenase [Conexibacter stalactiti]MEC5034694.1 aldehyde dehydrogenase [Conexibacter stalactiti]